MRTVPTSPKVRLAALGLFCALGLSFGAPALADQHLREDGSAIIYTEIIYPTSGQDTSSFTSLDARAEYFAEGKVEDLAQYISIIYNFLISIVGLVASVAMIVGGFQYLTSAGDASKIGAAKTRMTNAFMGMILALGAFTILRTVNPALLTMKSLNVSTVDTEVFTLPTCEDLGLPVKQLGPETTCGYAGEYAVGNGTGICIYSGSCKLPNLGNGLGHRTCMQRAGVQLAVVKEELAKNPNAKFAECLACGDVTINRAVSMGFELEGACNAWENAFSKVPDELKYYERDGMTVKKGLFYACNPRVGKEGCIGVALYCYDITRDDDTVGDDEGYVATGCEGYDEDPYPVWASTLDSNGFNQNQYMRGNKPEDYPVHLATICARNPCREYLDPKTNLQPFIKGCKGDNGIVFAAQRIVRHGDIGAIDDCRNQ